MDKISVYIGKQRMNSEGTCNAFCNYFQITGMTVSFVAQTMQTL